MANGQWSKKKNQGGHGQGGSIAIKQREAGKLESGGEHVGRDGKSSKERILEMEEEKQVNIWNRIPGYSLSLIS